MNEAKRETTTAEHYTAVHNSIQSYIHTDLKGYTQSHRHFGIFSRDSLRYICAIRVQLGRSPFVTVANGGGATQAISIVWRRKERI